ncbi:MAG TPA: c-type cytochrome biogenesis protein CcsB, partial [Phycisphaerales bacterium]|nr:c-type cytochrome biogenesis protein CcsB [Phycisphaerales bacterium]
GIIHLALRLPAKRKLWLSRIELFDNITYRAIALGYPLLTVGIVTGAIWANSCWGRYWSWDPKEMWSLITWIIYSVCLHLRYAAGWKGRWAAWAAIAGFISVIFTYLGVNYLFTGLHSYA